MRALVALGVAVAFGACKNKLPTFEEMQEARRKELGPIIERHKAPSTAKLDALRAIAKDAPAAPPVETREPATTFAISDTRYPEEEGVLVANLEELVAFDGTNTAPVTLRPGLSVAGLQGVLGGNAGDVGNPPASIDAQLGVLEKLRHVALVRVRSYQPPRPAEAGRFEGGRAVGDVLVYEIDARKRVGAFPFEILQGTEATVGRGTVEADLAQSFASSFEFRLRGELAAFAAGKPGPATPGAGAAEDTAAFATKIRLELGTEYLMAGVERVDIVDGDDGRPIVTIQAETPAQLSSRDGSALPGVRALVKKILGTEAEVRITASQPR